MVDPHSAEEAVARQIIADHGSRASIVAGDRLNECIDRGDRRGRDYWVQVLYYVRWLEDGRPINR